MSDDTESREEFLRRIGIQCQANADQKRMALTERVTEMMRVWMDIHTGLGRENEPIILSRHDGKLVYQALSLLCYELTHKEELAEENAS